LISFIVPAFNEVESLGTLASEIVEVCSSRGLQYEILFVDDGSNDGTWEEIVKICAKHETVRGFRLRRNFGKGAAMAAGFEAAKGTILFTLDADLQDNPADIPKLLEQIHLGADVVVGWRKLRNDTRMKRLQSKIYNGLARVLTGVRLRDINCGFKCFRSEVVAHTTVYGDRYRVFPVAAALVGFRVTETEVVHRERRHGQTKYGYGRVIRGILDLITVAALHSFRFRPMHLLGTIGFASFALGGIGMAYLGATWFLGDGIGRRPMLPVSIGACLFGVQMLLAGFLAELFTGLLARSEGHFSVAELATGNKLLEVSRFHSAPAEEDEFKLPN